MTVQAVNSALSNLHALWVIDKQTTGSTLRMRQLVSGGPSDIVSFSTNETPSVVVGQYEGSLFRAAMNTHGMNTVAGQENIQGSDFTLIGIFFRAASGVAQNILLHAAVSGSNGVSLNISAADIVRFTTFGVADNNGPTISGERGKMWFIAAVSPKIRADVADMSLLTGGATTPADMGISCRRGAKNRPGL